MPADPAGGLVIAEPAGRYAARPPLVVDCSVMAAFLFDEPERDTAAFALAGREIYVPDLLAHELANVAVKKAIQGLDEVAREGLADFAELDCARCEVDVTAQWRLALEHRVTAYDAAYLWLASELRAPLVTFDKGLGEAARRLFR